MFSGSLVRREPNPLKALQASARTRARNSKFTEEKHLPAKRMNREQPKRTPSDKHNRFPVETQQRPVIYQPQTRIVERGGRGENPLVIKALDGTDISTDDGNLRSRVDPTGVLLQQQRLLQGLPLSSFNLNTMLLSLTHLARPFKPRAPREGHLPPPPGKGSRGDQPKIPPH